MTDQTPQVRAIATQLIRNAIKQIDSEVACDHIVATLGEGVDVDALAFGSESAVRKARIDISWDDPAAAPPSAGTPREQLLHAIDFAACQTHGYGTPEELLAAYDASRTSADPGALREAAAQAIRDAACTGDCGQTEEECAKERVQPFAWHHGRLAVVEGSPEQLADAVLAAVLPATTRHNTDTSAELASLAVNAGRALQDEKRHYEIACRENARLRKDWVEMRYRAERAEADRRAVLREEADRLVAEVQKAQRHTPDDARLPGLLAAIEGLRRRADETAATETEAGTGTLSALVATVRDLQALQQPLVDALRLIREDMDRARRGGDEWAEHWLGEVWTELPLVVRAAGGDTEAAHEVAAGARQDGEDRG